MSSAWINPNADPSNQDNSSKPKARFSSRVNEIVRHTRLSRQTVNEHRNKLAADNKLVKTGRGEYVPRELFDCFRENNLPMRVSKPYLLGYLTASIILDQKNVGDVHRSQ